MSAFLILLGIGVLSYQSTVRNEEDRGWVTHTHLVLEKLQAILIDITQAEAGERSYLLTGQEKELVPYRDGLAQVEQDMKSFRNLTSDNPRQQEAIRRLEPLVATRVAGLEEQSEIRSRSGLAAVAEAAAKENRSEELMDEIRARMSEMKDEEDRLLAIRLRAAGATTRKMKAVIVMGNGLAFLILLAAGSLIHREAIRRDLAERELQRVNEHLEQRSGELSEANEELESFSYSVAHDLRAPLRQIAGYSNVLLQDHGAQLDAEARRYLEKVGAGASKMGRLVDDLLSLSKIGRQELSLHPTPLNALLRQVVEDLAPDYCGRDVEWRIGELPSAECDAGLMKQVFANLLSNAVKYTGKRERAVIQIGQMMQDDRPTIFVRDNGAGFEMQYVNKLFGVFQRLHKARDFEGTGIGLAIVQRIIRKHGGRIWAEGEVERGATFFFTLGSPHNNPNKEQFAIQ